MPTPEEIVIGALQKLDVPYGLIDIDPRFADTAAFCPKVWLSRRAFLQHDHRGFQERTEEIRRMRRSETTKRNFSGEKQQARKWRRTVPFCASLFIYRSVEVFSCTDKTCQPVNWSFKPRTASASCCPSSSGMVAMAFSLNPLRGSNRMDSEQGANLPNGIPLPYTTT